MRIGFVSDVHVGNHRQFGGRVVCGTNYRCNLALDVLRAAVRRADTLSCDLLCVLGDLFDSDRPEPQSIAAVIEILVASRGHICLLAGNHEQLSGEYGDNSLAPLRRLVHCLIDTTKLVVAKNISMLCVPATADPLAVIDKYTDSYDLLLLHAGLCDAMFPDYLRNIGLDVESLAAVSKASVVLAGDFHRAKRWNLHHCTIAQVGALCPVSWSDAGLENVGWLWIYDTASGLSQSEQIPGPRFVTTIDEVSRARSQNCIPFLRLRGVPEELADLRQQLISLDVLGDVILDDTVANAEIRDAASGARNAETLLEAVTLYVNTMHLPELANRMTVLRKSLEFLDL